HDTAVESVGPVTRAAVNLRGIGADDLGRGDVLLTPGAWSLTGTVDVRRSTGADFEDAPRELAVHVGTAAVQARLRPLGAEHARLTLSRSLPLTVGDRMLLRSTGSRAVRAGVQVLDIDPPALVRRGDGRRRTETLAGMSADGDVAHEVRRRGAVPVAVLASAGIAVPGETGAGTGEGGGHDRDQDPAGLPDGIVRVRDLLVDAGRLAGWAQALATTVEAETAADPLSPGISGKAAVDRLGLPDLRGGPGETGGGVRPGPGGSGGARESAGSPGASGASGASGSPGAAVTTRAPGAVGSGRGEAQQSARSTSALLSAIVREAGLVVEDGRIRPAGALRSMGAAETAIRELEHAWARQPFRAPEEIGRAHV